MKQILMDPPTLRIPSGMEFAMEREIDHRIGRQGCRGAGEVKQGPPWRDF